jgi:hypothetical protein
MSRWDEISYYSYIKGRNGFSHDNMKRNENKPHNKGKKVAKSLPSSPNLLYNRNSAQITNPEARNKKIKRLSMPITRDTDFGRVSERVNGFGRELEHETSSDVLLEADFSTFLSKFGVKISNSSYTHIRELFAKRIDTFFIDLLHSGFQIILRKFFRLLDKNYEDRSESEVIVSFISFLNEKSSASVKSWSDFDDDYPYPYVWIMRKYYVGENLALLLIEYLGDNDVISYSDSKADVNTLADECPFYDKHKNVLHN